jgi:integrase
MKKAVVAGVPRFTEHDLRAFTACESTTLAEAQQRLGHASPENHASGLPQAAGEGGAA